MAIIHVNTWCYNSKCYITLEVYEISNYKFCSLISHEMLIRNNMFRYTICQNLDCPNFVLIGNSFPKRTLFSVTIQSHIHATSLWEKSSTKLSSVDNFYFFNNFSIFSAAFFKRVGYTQKIFLKMGPFQNYLLRLPHL